MERKESCKAKHADSDSNGDSPEKILRYGKVSDVTGVHPEIASHEVQRQEYDRDYRQHQNGFTVVLKPNIDEMWRG